MPLVFFFAPSPEICIDTFAAFGIGMAMECLLFLLAER